MVNTVEPTVELSKQDRRAEVGVLLACDKDQKAKLRVSVTQRSGAFAQRKRKVNCTTFQRRFAVKAKLRPRSGSSSDGGSSSVELLAL